MTHRSCERLLRRASSLVPRPPCRHRCNIRSFSKLTSTNAHPDPFEQQTAYWADPANNRDVYIYPIGMGARHIVLNRPKALNSLSLPMISQLSSIVSAIEKDVDVGLAIMSGAGGKAFCAGGDIRALYDAGLKRKSLNNLTGPSDPTKLFFKKEYELNFQLSHTRVPLVPVLNGIVMGGGFGISGHLRYRCATPESMFAMPETSIGFFPDVGSSYLLPRLHFPYLGEYLGLTGARLFGYDLVHAGIATHYSTHNDWPSQLELAFSTTGSTYEQAEDSIENIGWHLNELDRTPEPEFSLSKEKLNFIRETFSLPTIEEIIEKLTATANTITTTTAQSSTSSSSSSSSSLIEFASQTLKSLSKSSPLSLKVTHQLLKRGKKLSLPECLKMEYRLTQRFIEGDDFYIGVNSALISKDKNPQWKNSKLNQITEKQIENYFDPLSDQEELELKYPAFRQPQWYI